MLAHAKDVRRELLVVKDPVAIVVIPIEETFDFPLNKRQAQ
jgi:hypothetical protein